ncbi:MAG: hypothetical protein WCQ99_15195 [Pseudomonadota bacterium]
MITKCSYANALRQEIHSQLYDNMRSIAAIADCRKDHVLFSTLINEKILYDQKNTGINAVIQQVALDSGYCLIDADQTAAARNLQDLVNPGDNYHLTDTGNEFLSGLIAGEIGRVVQSRK